MATNTTTADASVATNTDHPSPADYQDALPTLLSLPIEIFECIAELADPQDLPKLRLLNKEVCAKVKRTFIATHFGRPRGRAFLLSQEDSLHTLLSIVEHEDFAPALTHVQLCAEEVHDPHCEDPHDGDAEQNHLRHDGCSSSRAIAFEDQLRHVEHSRVYMEQQEFRERGGDLHLLTVIFARLRRYANPIALSILAGIGDEDPPICERATLISSIGENEIIMSTARKSLAKVLDAVVLAALPIRKFVVDRKGSWPSLYKFTWCPSIWPNARLALRGLEHLDYAYHTDEDMRYQPDGGRYIASEVTEFADFVQSCTSLQTLKLERLERQHKKQWDMVDCRSCINNVLLISLPKLQCVYLAGFDLSFAWLRTFIQRNQPVCIMLLDLVFHCSDAQDAHWPSLTKATDFDSCVVRYSKEWRSKRPLPR